MAERKDRIIPVQETRIIRPVLEQVRRGLEITQPDEEVRKELLKQVNVYDLSKNLEGTMFDYVNHLAILGPTPKRVAVEQKWNPWGKNAAEILVDLDKNNNYYNTYNLIQLSKMVIESGYSDSGFIKLGRNNLGVGYSEVRFSNNDGTTRAGGNLIKYYAEANILEQFDNDTRLKPAQAILIIPECSLSDFLIKKFNGPYGQPEKYNIPFNMCLVNKFEEVTQNPHSR